jgi:hypothetical protein
MVSGIAPDSNLQQRHSRASHPQAAAQFLGTSDQRIAATSAY